MYNFFQIHNVSNKIFYIKSLDSAVAPYVDIPDERLHWLNITFPNYIEHIQNSSLLIGFQGSTNETAHALIFTARSTYLCIEFLLQQSAFYCVLTRSFSSDAVEGMFSHVRLKGGSNDAADGRTVEYALRQILRCGIVKCSESSNTAETVNSVSSAKLLFVCLCTKAGHLELVTDLTSEAFLNALRRFISRRGFVKQLFSDNATNFKASEKELKEMYNVFKNKDFHNKITCTLANNNISWSFIPPRSPNFGGFWKAGIKSVKYHIKRVVGETILTYEEMYTLLTRIEACLNSRPLFPISNDPNDLNALTPSHLLIGGVLTAPLEHDLTEIKVNRLSR
jgi:hypothetical protein